MMIDINRNNTHPWDRAHEVLGYVPDRDLDANNCEFYLDGTYGWTAWHNGATADALEFYFKVDRKSLVEEQQGEILNLACYLGDHQDGWGMQKDYISLVKAEEDKLRLLLFSKNPSDQEYKVTSFAFFLDVRRRDGQIDRLWLKNGNSNFTRDDVAPRETIKYITPGREYYVAETSALFNQKHACGR